MNTYTPTPGLTVRERIGSLALLLLITASLTMGVFQATDTLTGLKICLALAGIAELTILALSRKEITTRIVLVIGSALACYYLGLWIAELAKAIF